jgi:hypothetical protein
MNTFPTGGKTALFIKFIRRVSRTRPAAVPAICVGHLAPRLSAKTWRGRHLADAVLRLPQVDNGYDVANYTAIDPSYGTLDDFDELVAEAKARGIRIVLDMVFNHTSTAHAWFRESLNKESPTASFISGAMANRRAAQ